MAGIPILSRGISEIPPGIHPRPKRILWQSELDQRYYLMKEIERRQHIAPQPNSNWHFHPKQWTDAAALRDRKIIFGE